MKTLRFIGMALSAVILSVNFAACSDDDEDVQGGDTSITQKYIVSQTFLNSFPHMSDSEYSATASYDENNRLSRINDMSNSMGDDYDGWNKATIIFDYDNFKISYKDDSHGLWDTEFSFKMNESGCITEMTEIPTGDKSAFTYDKENHLVSSTYYNAAGKYTETSAQTWQDGNLVRGEADCHDRQDSFDIKYSNLINKGNIQPYYGLFNNSLWRIFPTERIGNILMSSGLFGKLSRNLPSQISSISIDQYGNDSWTDNYTYQLDLRGFVSSVTVTSDNENSGTWTGSFFYKE